jgi:hypothetical protein
VGTSQAGSAGAFSPAPEKLGELEKIERPNLLDPSGRFVRRGCDKALMYPLFELARAGSYFVDEVLYVFKTYDRILQYDSRKKVPPKGFTRCIRAILKRTPFQPPLTSI